MVGVAAMVLLSAWPLDASSAAGAGERQASGGPHAVRPASAGKAAGHVPGRTPLSPRVRRGATQWTATSVSRAVAPGRVATTYFARPQFHRTRTGWKPLSGLLRHQAGPFGWRADDTVVPTDFGVRGSTVLRLHIPQAVVPIKMVGAHLSQPTVRQPHGSHYLTYRHVFPGVDASYRIQGPELKESLTLRSPSSRRTFTFRISDPRHRLGRPSTAADGTVSFPREVAPGFKAELSAPLANDSHQPAAGTGAATPDTRGPSAHQQIRVTPQGYTVRLSVDKGWARSQTFPVILDPSLVYTPSSTPPTMATAYAPIGSTACSGSPCPLSTRPDGSVVVAHDDAGLGETHAYFQVDLSNIPASDAGTLSAGFGFGYTYQEYTDVDLHQMTALMGPTATGADLAAAEDSAVIGHMDGGTTVFQNPVTLDSSPGDLDLTAPVQHWVATGNGANAAWALAPTPGGSDPSSNPAAGPPCADAGTNYGLGCYINPQLTVTSPGYLPPTPLPEEQTWGCDCRWSHGPDVAASAADPVHTNDASQFEDTNDLAVTAPGIDFNFRRSYNGADTTDGPLGVGWTDEYNASITPITGGSGDVTFRDPTGGQSVFRLQPGGSYLGDPGVTGTLSAVTGGGWKLVSSLRRETLVFDADGHEIQDIDGNGTGQTITWTGSGASAHVSDVTDSTGRSVTFGYGTTGASSGKLTQLTADDGRTVEFDYTTIASASHLTSVTAPDSQVTTLTYDSSNGKLTGISAPDPGHVSVQDTFDTTTGRVKTQTDADGNLWHFDWSPETTEPAGSGTEVTTDPNGNTTTDVYYGNVLTQRTQHVDATHDSTTYYYYNANDDLIAVTDPNGNTTSMTYDTHGRMLTRNSPDPGGTTETWTYDTAGNVLTHTDGRGKTTTNTYYSSDLLHTSQDPRGHTTTYTYYPSGRLDTVQAPRDASTFETTQYFDDTDGNLTSTVAPSGATTTYDYWPQGWVKSMTDPDGNVSGASPATVEAHTTHYTYYDNGLTHTVTDPNDNVTTYTYDGEHHLTETTVADPASTVASDTINTYDPNGNLLTTEVNGVLKQTNHYDGAGNLDWTKDGDADKTTFTYDGANRVTTKVMPDGNVTGGTPADYTWTYGYDANGNRTSVLAPGAAAATITDYDERNRPVQVTTPGGSVTQTSYDGDGNVTSVTDPNLNTTTYQYNDDNNQTEVISPRNKTATTNYFYDGLKRDHTAFNGTSTTRWTYDADGNVASVEDPDLNTTGYDRYPSGLVQTVHRADTSTLGYTYDGDQNQLTYVNARSKTTTYGYNALNQQTSVKDPLNRATTTTYDPAGVVTKVTDPDTKYTTYTVDPAERTTAIDYSAAGTPDVSSIGYDADGNRTSMTDGTGSSSYGYDTQDRLTDATTAAGHTGYSYDADSNVNQIAYPNGNHVVRTFDPAEQLHTVKDWNNQTTTFDYNSDGALADVEYPNGVTATYGVDDNDQTTSITDTTGSGPTLSTLGAFDYGTRDANGQITSETDTGTGQAPQTYTYNALNQLKTINAGTLTYNAADDPTTLANGASVVYDDADQATNYTPPSGTPISGSSTTLSYDQQGTRTPDSVAIDMRPVAYLYDQAHRLTSASRSAFAPTVSAGFQHTLAIQPDATVIAWGNNANGQIGDGTTTNRKSPQTVAGLSGATTVAAGRGQSLAVTAPTSGSGPTTVWAWGNNATGQLGIGNTTNQTSPTQVTGAASAIEVTAGNGSSAALMPDGTVKTWGDNTYGQLGDGTTTQRTSPVTVTGLSHVVEVSAAGSYMTALKSDGTVWSWGRNQFGQLGNNTFTNSSTPVQVQNLSGTVRQIDTSSSGAHTMALLDNGTVQTWGHNDLGQLGTGNTTNAKTATTISGVSNVVSVAAGDEHSLAIEGDGTTWAWGDNTYGQLGDGTTTGHTTPTQIGSGFTTSDTITAGGFFTITAKPDGAIYSWGRNDTGQLGDTTTTQHASPEHIGGSTNAIAPGGSAFDTYTYNGDGIRATATTGATTHTDSYDTNPASTEDGAQTVPHS